MVGDYNSVNHFSYVKESLPPISGKHTHVILKWFRISMQDWDRYRGKRVMVEEGWERRGGRGMEGGREGGKEGREGGRGGREGGREVGKREREEGAQK